MLSQQGTWLSVVLSLGQICHGEMDPGTVWCRGSIPPQGGHDCARECNPGGTERLGRFGGWRKKTLLQPSPRSPDTVPSPARWLPSCPPRPPWQSGASPARAAGLLGKTRKHSPAWRESQMTGDGKDAVQGKAILGGRNPPSLLPVLRSGVSETHRSAHQCWCRLGWHVCGSTAALAVGMLPTPVSPSPCGDATGRHGQHRHQPRQAVEEGAQGAAA